MDGMEWRTLALPSVSQSRAAVWRPVSAYRGCVRRVHRPLAEAVPVEALEPPEGRGGHVAMTPLSTFREEEKTEMKRTSFGSICRLYLCFWMSFTPFFWFPSRSDGLSLRGRGGEKRKHTYRIAELFVTKLKKKKKRLREATCTAAWRGWRRSWRSFWGTRSCRCPAGWCCRSSWDQSLRKEGWGQGTAFTQLRTSTGED